MFHLPNDQRFLPPSWLYSNSQINCFIIVLWIKACAELYTSFFYPGELFVPQSKWCNILWKTPDLKLRRYPWDAKMNLESHIQYHIRYFLTNIRPAHIKHRYIVPPVCQSLILKIIWFHYEKAKKIQFKFRAASFDCRPCSSIGRG